MHQPYVLTSKYWVSSKQFDNKFKQFTCMSLNCELLRNSMSFSSPFVSRKTSRFSASKFELTNDHHDTQLKTRFFILPSWVILHKLLNTSSCICGYSDFISANMASMPFKSRIIWPDWKSTISLSMEPMALYAMSASFDANKRIRDERAPSVLSTRFFVLKSSHAFRNQKAAYSLTRWSNSAPSSDTIFGMNVPFSCLRNFLISALKGHDMTWVEWSKFVAFFSQEVFKLPYRLLTKLQKPLWHYAARSCPGGSLAWTVSLLLGARESISDCCRLIMWTNGYLKWLLNSPQYSVIRWSHFFRRTWKWTRKPSARHHPRDFRA